ncbi:MAG: energy-coupling factor ABC transporter ATP-binding protein [Arthrobacter sp.]|nr:energy-coupling factor ABC transporter ATP-binding protein [Arthrobacter sp.]
MTASTGIELRRAAVTAPAVGGAAARTLLSPTSLRLSESRVALIGANGQGKTTLLRLLAGLIAPSSGTVLVNGLDWASDAKRLRGSVGLLFADTAAQLIMPVVQEDVELSLRPRKLARRERAAQAAAELAALGIESLAERSVYELSGGERQLVALAGLRAAAPQLLLADEPTAALDLVHRDRVAEALLASEAAVVVATHDLELAAECERALWIHGGRVVADGLPEPLIAAYRASARGAAPWPTGATS